MPNDYSDNWFELFMDTMDPEQTRREVEFLRRQLPLPRYRKVLDVCCGTGRHAELLADAGYQMTAIDVNPRALATATQRLMGRGTVIRQDMRELNRLDGEFDAILLL